MKKALIILFAYIAYLISASTSSAAQEVKRILIVPGHDEESSGALFGVTREVDVNHILAGYLEKELKQEPHVEIIMAHEGFQYANFLESYFKKEDDEIEDFIKDAKRAFRKEVRKGNIKLETAVPHGTANETTAFRLYGINKWANEHDIDLVLHLHFNDYGSRPWWGGEYTGFAVYVPHKELNNSEAAIDVGNDIYRSLSEILFPSNNPTEAKFDGAIEDYELIALGANNTLDVPSVLIEYSYIYEPYIQSGFFDRVAQELAYRTRIGLSDFIQSTSSLPTIKPYTWTSDLKEDMKAVVSRDVYMLQLALKLSGVYPEAGKTQFDCPITGVFGECTKNALKEFQEKHSLPATGYFGPMTRALFNRLY